MRKIKFRIWGGFQMWYCGIQDISDFLASRQKSCDHILQIHEFTGLKDKNGKEIYEGDILMNQAEAKREIKRTTYGEYKLFCGKHSGSFNEWIKDTEWEVIGNIYENPELLEK
jgi:hypothetical protein